ncbi:E3 ubiquitin-protein ligase XB3-like [Zingiber officinale]|uniref:E3 ubiquitin-protein ligase XB3-like n=1 Tax=Zingiber officinale TaxID=94328 RepID=UPI001C4D31EC|nr:E3 ubiquitin-protein ligase XB3-like [Zingiber officinale]
MPVSPILLRLGLCFWEVEKNRTKNQQPQWISQSTVVVDSWGFARFVNVGDERGETPLHLAARRRWTECVRVLLDHGALVSSSTREYGHSGSTPLHLAARGGSLDCVRTLLAWGADQLLRDSSGRIPYSVAIKHNHGACAALLNPSVAEPLVWPSPLKFISELDPDARALLEVALMDANKESEKIILNERKKLLSPANVDEAFHDDASEASRSCGTTEALVNVTAF